MKLLWSPRSPYVRKVLVAAAELGRLDEFELEDGPIPATSLDHPMFAANPLGTIPVLYPSEGGTIYDSYVIVEYLDGAGGGRLIPPLGAARLAALRWHALGHGLMDQCLARMGDMNTAPKLRDPVRAERRELKIASLLRACEGEVEALGAAPYALGHIAIGCALDYLGFRWPGEGWRATHPRLAAWYEGHRARPAVAAVRAISAY